MRTVFFVPAALAAALILSLPVASRAAQEHPGHVAAPAKPAAPAPAVDPDKAYLLKQEFTAKTAELRGKIKAREADLEILLATKPGDEASVKKLAGDIAVLRGQLAEQTVLFRLRYAKETGTPLRQTLHLGGGHDGMMAGMGQGGMDCMMLGKGQGMGQGMMMGGMDHGAMEHGPAAAPAPAASTPPAPAPAAKP